MMKRLMTCAAGLIAAVVLAGTATAQTKDWSTIRIATEGAYKPWNFTDASGKLVGYELDLAADLCARIKAKCEISAQAFDGMIPGLNAGKFDAIMAGMNISPKRLEAINFSLPYGRTPSTFAVTKDSPLAKMPDADKVYSLIGGADLAAAEKAAADLKPMLKGKVIGAQTSTIQANFIEQYFKDVAEIRQYKTTEQHDLDLLAGRLDAVFASMSYLKGVTEENKEIVMAGPRFTGGILGAGVAVGLRKGDTELKEKFDAAVAAAIADGTVSKLSTKWFGFDITPKG